MQVSWTVLKNIIDTKKINFQSNEESDRYIVTVFDNSYGQFGIILKTSPRNSDQIDYEDNYLADANKVIEDNIKNIINREGTQGSLTVGTTAVEVRVGASRLAGRKTVSLHNNSNQTIYWGYNSAVTTSTGTPIERAEFVVWSIGEDLPIFVIAGSAGNNARITEAG